MSCQAKSKTLANRIVNTFMSRIERDEVQENRIADEAIPDAYGPEEQAMSWYYYLEEKIYFPCKARCVAKRAISPLQVGEKVKVLEMAPESECKHDMFVMVQWQGREFGVPLAQIAVIDGDEETEEAIEDWHYWINRGHQF